MAISLLTIALREEDRYQGWDVLPRDSWITWKDCTELYAERKDLRETSIARWVYPEFTIIYTFDDNAGDEWTLLGPEDVEMRYSHENNVYVCKGSGVRDGFVARIKEMLHDMGGEVGIFNHWTWWPDTFDIELPPDATAVRKIPPGIWKIKKKTEGLKHSKDNI